MDKVKLDAIVMYLWKYYFHKSSNFFCHKAIKGTNSYYIVHKGYPGIRISDHVVHPDSFNDKHIYVDVLKDGYYVNGKLVLTKYANQEKHLQLLLEVFDLEMYLAMVNSHSKFLMQWQSKRRKPLYYENSRKRRDKVFIFT